MKSLKVQAVIFENKDEVEIIMSALNAIKNNTTYPATSREKIRSMLHELYKIKSIYEATNNN